MTNCKSKPLTFSPLSGRKVLADFSGGSISSDAGSLLLREADKKIGLIESIAKVMSDRRNPDYTKHEFVSLLRQRVYGLACGYEDLNDHSELRYDDVFQTAVGETSALASSATLCRLENTAPHQDSIAMHEVIFHNFVRKHKGKPPAEFVLDFDATDALIYGNQEQGHYNGYYKDHCYMPLYVFCGNDLLVSYLRPSNIDGARHAWAILMLLTKALREHFPNTKIHFRADSGFARHRILRWCEKNAVNYTVGLPSNPRLRAHIKLNEAGLASAYEESEEEQLAYFEFQYAAKSWVTERRIIARCQVNHHGSGRRFIMTNSDAEPEDVYENRYCQRGDMENQIKQQKLDLRANRTSCHRFQANQMRVLFSALAHILIQTVQEGAKDVVIESAYAGTVRLKLIKIGAVVIKNTRRIHIKMSEYFPRKDIFTNCVNYLVPT